MHSVPPPEAQQSSPYRRALESWESSPDYAPSPLGRLQAQRTRADHETRNGVQPPGQAPWARAQWDGGVTGEGQRALCLELALNPSSATPEGLCPGRDWTPRWVQQALRRPGDIAERKLIPYSQGLSLFPALSAVLLSLLRHG